MIRAASRVLAALAVIVSLSALPSDASLFRTGAPAAVSYVGPGDLTTFSSWWGLRCYKAALATGTTKVAKIKRASDSTSTDIVCLTNGKFDTATASSFCNATTCTVTELYDQVGTNNLTATFSLFPSLVFNCNGTYPCMKGQRATTAIKGTVSITPTTGNGTQYLVGNTYIWASGGVVGMFYVNGGAVTCICMTHEQIANHWDLSNNALVFTAPANDAAWHVGVGISNLSATDLTIDGADTAASFASASSDTGVTELTFGDSTGVVGMETEEYGWVDNSAWSHGSSVSTACQVSHNAGTFYGITVGGSC